jgi:hypothetical protein
MAEYIRGEIFIDVNFYYRDAKEPCDKRLLILNKDHTTGEDVIVVPATRNAKHYPYKHGCNRDERIYYFETQQGYYESTTMIQYDFMERITSDEFEHRIKYREMKRKNIKIEDMELQGILKCLQSIKEDVEGEIIELIF